MLIENELYKGSSLICGERFRGKKERSRNLIKTVIIMLASFYQNFLEKYPNKAQLITLKMLVWLLQNQKQVRIIGWQQRYHYQYSKTAEDDIYKDF